MGRTKYLFYAVKNLDKKNMFKTIKKISEKSNKNTIIIFLDVVWCGIRYQAGYYDYLEFEFYNLNSKQRKTYVTRGINNQIVKKYNDKSKWYIFDDKVQFHKLFKDFTKRKYLKLDNNIEEFEKFLKEHQKIIAKPIAGTGGNGILKIEYDANVNFEQIYEQLVKNNQLLIEEYISQHSKLNELYADSVNSLRMFTFIENGNSHFLQAVLKLGNGSIVDNFNGGGMYTILSDDGIVVNPAIDKNDNIFTIHPITNQSIIGFKVPMFEEAVNLVKEAAKMVPEVGYIGWDVAITNDGPIIIEGNCYPGVFQLKPSLSKNKQGVLTKYKKHMKI